MNTMKITEVKKTLNPDTLLSLKIWLGVLAAVALVTAGGAAVQIRKADEHRVAMFLRAKEG